MDLTRIIKGQKKYKGCTREQLILKTKASPRAIDRQLAKLDKLGKIKKRPAKRLIYTLK